MISTAPTLALGEAHHNDAFTAAQQAARQAMEQLGGAPSWGLVVCWRSS